MKNLIVINDPHSPLDALQSSLKTHQKQHKARALKNLPFEGSGLIVLIYPSARVSEQLELLKTIKSKWPKIGVIFCGRPLNFKEIISLFRAGLADYLSEPIDVKDFTLSIQRLNRININASFDPSKFNLSKREYEVCMLLVEGLNGKKAAEYLQITPATIKVHKSRIMNKLGVKNLPDLVRMVGY